MLQGEQLGKATAGVSGASSGEALRHAATMAGFVIALILAGLAAILFTLDGWMRSLPGSVMGS